MPASLVLESGEEELGQVGLAFVVARLVEAESELGPIGAPGHGVGHRRLTSHCSERSPTRWRSVASPCAS